MARDTKVGLLIALSLILLIGIIISDQLSVIEPGEDTPEAIVGFGARAQESIDTHAAEPSRRIDPPTEAPPPTARVQPIPTARELAQAQRQREDPSSPTTGSSNVSETAPAGRTIEDGPAATPSNSNQPTLPRAMTLDATMTPLRPESFTRSGNADQARPPTPEIELSRSQQGGAPIFPVRPGAGDATESQLASDRGVRETIEPEPIDQPLPNEADQPDGARDLVHQIEEGETLAALARAYYGNGDYWTSIAEANPDAVDEDGHVRAGVRLVIPNRSDRPISADASPGQPSLDQVAAANNVQLERIARGRQPGSSSPSSPTITVETGQTLSGLADQYLGSEADWRRLIEANRDRLDNPQDLRAGMDLRLPADADVDVSGSTPNPPAPQRYTVQAGDTLAQIAQRFMGDRRKWRVLYEANRDRLESADQLVVGAELRIPG